MSEGVSEGAPRTWAERQERLKYAFERERNRSDCRNGPACASCWNIAEASIPPVVVVNSAEVAAALADVHIELSGFGKRVLATLRYYEAESGPLHRLTGKLIAERRELEAEVDRLQSVNSTADEAELIRLKDEVRWARFDADIYEKLYNALTIEAPFAAVGRGLLDPECDGEDFAVLTAAAWAALAKEAKEPEWSELAPSGTRYRMDGDVLQAGYNGGNPWIPSCIPVEDAAFVVALMGGGK